MRGLATVLIAFLAIATPHTHAQTNGDQPAAFRTDFLAGKLTWEQIRKQAGSEGRANLFIWGGNDVLNLWIDSVAGQRMADLGITLYPSRLTATRDAVDLVIQENSRGKTIGEGSTDLIWLNGENFLALKERGLLFGAFAQSLPNSDNFDWDRKDRRSHPNLFDFGVETNGLEIPWTSEQYVCAVDRRYVPTGSTPATFADLETHLQNNPGRFSYIAPPAKSGTAFVVAALYAHNPDGNGATPFQNSATSIGAAELARLMSPGLDYLRRLQAHLLRDGSGAPRYLIDSQEADGLFRHGTIHFTCAFGTYKTASRITTGRYPNTAEAMIFPKGMMIKTKTFLTIPRNAVNPAAALVLANYLTSAESQASLLRVVGYAPGIDLWTLKETDAKQIEAVAPPHVGVTQAQLDANAVPDAHASLIGIIAEAWKTHVLQGNPNGLEQTIARTMADVSKQ